MMKQKTTFFRFVTLICLVCVMLLTSACTKPKKNTNDTTPSSGPTSEGSPLEQIPIVDFGDRDFTILSAGYCDNWSTEDEGNPVGQVVYKRTLAFEERYHTTVCTVGANADSVYQGLQTTHMMNDTSYDLVFPHPTIAMSAMMVAGYFADLTQISTMDLSGKWYNRSQVENYTANQKLYVLASDITICDQGFFALVYNRDVLAQFGFDADYVKDLVESGDWTMAALNEMVAQTASSDDGAEDTRTYGFVFNAAASARWMYAMDETILKKDESGVFERSLNSKKMVSIAEALEHLLYDNESATLIGSSYVAGLATSNIYQTFNSGRGLFVTWDIGSCYSYLRDISFKMGYAPIPKLDTAQEDYRVVCASGLLAIPSVTTSVEQSGLAMEYFAVYSHEYLRPAFYEVILGGRLSEYPQDYEMLEFLHSKKFFDFGYTLDEKGELIDILKKTVIDNRNASGMAVALKSCSPSINEIVERANSLP